MAELTERQKQILQVIQRLMEEKGVPPTRVELARAAGFKSPNAAEGHLRALARKGIIALLPGAARGIRITDPPQLQVVRRSASGSSTSIPTLRDVVAQDELDLIPDALVPVPGQASLPVVGRVAAGHPILAVEHIETRYAVDPKIFRPTAHYLLRVAGMSMRDAGILDGDLVAVHRSPEVRNGQIIVARVNHEEVTVKRYRQVGKEVWLLPENTEFKPIHLDLEHDAMVIEGVVVGVIRDRTLQ
jgi:repressor LexA